MNCTCAKRTQCTIHPVPLPISEVVEESVVVIRVYHRWPVGSKKTFFVTVARDAVRQFETAQNETPRGALQQALDRLSDS